MRHYKNMLRTTNIYINYKIDTPPSSDMTLKFNKNSPCNPLQNSYPQQYLVTPQPYKHPKTVISHRQRKNLISGAEEFKQKTLEPWVGVAVVLRGGSR